MTSGIVTRFTFDEAIDPVRCGQRDGSRIVWCSNREGQFTCIKKLASGEGQDELLHKSEYIKHPTDWSRDGRFIIYSQSDPKTENNDVWVLPVGPRQAGDQKPFPFLQTEANETSAVLSPDGRWMAYSLG